MAEYNERFDLASSVANFMVGANEGVGTSLYKLGETVGTKPRAFAVAMTADVVSTLWNTLVPERFEFKTEDFLRHVDTDAARMMEQSPDAVHFASMVAGSFVPAGIGMKMLSMARSGRLALGYSPEAIGASIVGSKQRALQAEIESVFRNAGADAEGYRQITRKMFAADVVQQAADNIVLEAAVALGMSAHPYMQDYWEEPYKNFAIGSVVGGVLGTAFAAIGTKAKIRRIEGPIELERHATILESGVQFVHPGFTNVARGQAHTRNIGILESLAGDINSPAPLRDMVNNLLIEERASAERSFQRAAPWIADPKTPKELRDQVVSLMQDPMFIGVDQIRVFNWNKFDPKTSKLVKIGKDVGDISETMLKETGKAETVVVRLGTGDTFALNGARSAALGADIPEIKTILAEQAKSTQINLAYPVRDWSETSLFRSKSSATQNGEFLKELAIDYKIFNKQMMGLTVAPDHLPRLNAFIAYADTLTPEQKARMKFRITGAFPTYQAQRTFIEQTVRPDYWHNVDNIARNSKVLDDYTPESEMIREWVSAVHDQGPRAQMRRAFDAYFRNIPPPKGEEDNVAIAQKIWEKGAPIREALHSQAANASGKIFLYRGLTKDPVGHSSVESYTNNPNVAGGVFAKEGEGPVLFEIPVENVITAFPLGASTKGGERFHEFLVGPPHHRIVNEVPMQTPGVKAMPIPDTLNKVDYNGLVKTYTDATEEQILALASTKGAQKFSPEEISSRLGVTKDGVMHVLGGGRLAEAQNWRMYTSQADLEKYIGPQNQLVALTGNPNRNHMAHAYSDLDIHQYRAQMLLETEQLTRSSKSIIANTLLDMLGSTGMKLQHESIHQHLGEIGNALVSKPTFVTADHALRELKDAAAITGIGKMYINVIDKLRKEIVEPLAMPFVGLRENPAKLLEMNRVILKMYSMSGWRDIVEDPLTGKWALVTKSGPKNDYGFVTHENGDTWYINQPEVAAALNSMREPSKQLLYMHNLNRKLRGYAPLDDMGFYIPPINLVNKNYAFVIDGSGKRGTELLIANTGPELESQIVAWNKSNPLGGSVRIVRKGQQEADNLASHYHGGDMNVTYANVAERHGGSSALAVLPSDARLLENILQGYETSIIQGGRNYASHYMRDTIDWLDHLSNYYRRNVKDQPKTGLKEENVKDAAAVVKNILLGQDQLGTHAGIKWANNMTEFLINSAGRGVDATWNTFGKSKNTREYFDELNAKMVSVGIDKPLYQSFDTYLASTIPEVKNIAPGIVSAGNGIVATMALRFLDTANAAINIMALPIMTWAALMEKLPGTPIGNGQSVKLPLRVMMDGIRHMFSPAGRAIEANSWGPQGLIDQILRQFEDTAVNLKRAGMGSGASERATEALHAVTNNKGFVGLLSTPSDWAEKFTRRFAMHTGYVAAKHAYPGLDDVGATLAAMHFADRTVGNYHAAQRPTIFQGTLGSMVGLYQTYMLTFAQHIYRGIENRNFKQLGGLMLAQAGLFGMKGLPGFNLLSEQVVSQFSNDNWDLTTGTYRAVGDPTAEMILYGLPSSITGTAFYTRGDITPRIPSTVGDIALLNTVRQGYELTTNVFSKVAQGAGDGNAVRGFFEALSLQSLNRPIARVSEILLGTSQTKQGNTVSTADQIWTPIGVAARLMGARPIEEQVTRETIHLNKFYEARDFENRQKVMERLKMALRSGDLNDHVMSSVADDYFRKGGSSQGWRAAMNKALINSDQGMRGDLRRKLEPGDPLHTMIDDLH